MARSSVIIATHSRPHLLPRSVASALDAGSDVEVVVVDDASTDSTAEVCKSLKGIHYIRLDDNLRVAGARNVGIRECSGKYVTFLDDDDVRLPGSLDRQAQALDEHPEAGIAYGRVILGDNDCTPTGQIDPKNCPVGDIFWDVLRWNFIHCISAVARRSSVIEVGMFDESLPGLDWDLWVRLAEKFPVVAVDEPVGVYRLPDPRSDQDSSRPARILLDAARTFDAWMQLPRAANAAASKRREAREGFLNRVSDALIFGAADALQAGVKRTARENLLAALRLNPRRAARPWTFKLLSESFYRPSPRLVNRRG